MLIRGGGQECVQVSGWFQIEQITLDPTHPNPAGSTLKTITVTFEQSCNGESAILRGCLHYEEP